MMTSQSRPTSDTRTRNTTVHGETSSTHNPMPSAASSDHNLGKSSSRLSWEQLRDLQDALRRCHGDSKVLLPLGPQAFCPGRLLLNEKRVFTVVEEDTRVEADTTQHRKLTRSEAMAALQREMDTLMGSIQKNKAVNEAPTSSSLPSTFFEIREELDEHGREVKSEAINVTQQLQFVKDKQQKTPPPQTNGPSDSKTDTEEMGDSLTANDHNDDLGDELMRNRVGDNSTDDDSDDEPMETIIPKNDITQVPNDDGFATLMARLDELARLEEQEEEQERRATQAAGGALRAKLSMSSKATPSTTIPAPQKTVAAPKAAQNAPPNKIKKKPPPSGWAKGFLNKPPQKKQSTTTKTPPPSAATSLSDTSQHNDNHADRPKVVGFSNDNEVREVPRIGQRSVPKPNTVPKPNSQNDLLFGGTVQEAPRSRRRNKNKPSTSAGNEAEPSQPPPMSLFARQRLEQRMQQQQQGAGV